MAKVNGSIVLSKRIESDGYSIVSSAEDIVRFKSKNSDTGEWGWETSPQVLQIQVYENGTSLNLEDNNNIGLACLDESIELTDYISKGEFTYDEETEQDILINTNILFFNIQKLLQDTVALQRDSIVFTCEYKVGNRVVASKAFQLRDGVGPEMAQFEVTAAAINQSVGDSKMSFTQDGLEINNGDFIIRENGNQVFGFETVTTDGQSISKLTMRGAIYADEGSFTGVIHATDAYFDNGEIGGFNISQNKLTSIGEIEWDGEKVPAIQLDGNNGSIIAHTIQLGDSATIINRIQLGNAYLFNPNRNHNKLLQVGADNQETILIKDDGTAKFGQLNIDGTASTISGGNWHITPTLASFSNVAVSGAIKTTVFETEATQAVGGTMVFLPSYRITLDDDEIIFQNETDSNWQDKIWGVINDEVYCKIFAENGRAWLVDEYNSYREVKIHIETNDKKIAIIKGEDWTPDFSPISLIYIGTTKDDNDQLLNPLIMGINSDSVKTAKGYLYGRGLTLTEYGNSKPNLFLGDLSYLTELSDPTKITYSGYGLYADNVYLNGSLTTKVGENSYAGINTLNGVSAIAFDEEYKGKTIPDETDKSKIVFWAGADSTNSDGIQNAYFQVTEGGSVYASRAKLTDSLIVGGILKATEIYTAALHGNGSALSIYDDSKGIDFKNSSESTIFSIKTNGFYTNNEKEFISINATSPNRVTFTGRTIKTDGDDNYLSITTKDRYTNETLTGSVPAIIHTQGEDFCGFYFDEGFTSFEMGQTSIQDWSIDGNTLYGNVLLTNKEWKLQYKPSQEGYDLYVTTSKKEE